MIQAPLLQLLTNKTPVFGISVRFRDPAIIEALGQGWDFAWVDLQHGALTLHDIPDILRTCDLIGLPAFVRMAASLDLGSAAMIMDMDPAGLIAAQVESVEQARALLAVLRFPPVGNRSYGGRRIIDRNTRNYVERANREQLLIAQIESPDALANAPAIAALDGIDGLMIGPDDLRLRLRQPLAAPIYDPVFMPCHLAMVSAARRSNKLAMGFAAPTPESLGQAVETGYNLISVTADVSLMKERNKQIMEVMQAAGYLNARK